MPVRVLILFPVIFVLSCTNVQISQPRPHQYPRIIFPQKQFEEYQNSECPFTIQIPTYATVRQKEFLFETIPAGQCWFDIVIDSFKATIHCSYYNFESEQEFGALINDAFNLASKHNIKASFREELFVENQFGASGLIFKISGPVATPYQFFMTDSTRHFLRGSLYYDVQVKPDSVAPVTDFLKQDIDNILASLQWTE